MNKLISIITVNYNDKNGLLRTIESVKGQSFTNYEHIIIDGGSTDGSKELIESHKANFNYWVSEADKGIYNAMNKGIKKANGEYLLFLNSGDDLEDGQSLERVHMHLNEKDIVYFNINMITDNGKYVKKCPERLSFTYLHNNLPSHQSTFFRRNLFDTYGYYDEKLKITADWKFLILAICKQNVTYKFVNQTFSNFYRDGLSSASSNLDMMNKEREAVLNQEFGIFMNDLKDRYRLERVLRTLRKSRTIKLLIKLRLIHKF